MVSGNSSLPNDSEFGVNERATEIYIPEQCNQSIETCKKKMPFKVNRMKQVNFVTLAPLIAAITKRNKDTSCSNKVEWLKMQWIRVLKEKPSSEMVKTATLSYFQIC